MHDNPMMKVGGYTIREEVVFDNGRGFAYGENPDTVQPFATWQLTEEGDEKSFYWGHYTDSEHKARRDFSLRAVEYQASHGVVIRSSFPEMVRYNYFSTQRPVDLGTFPKTENGPLSYVNFEERLPVEGGAFRAWGVLTYSVPLTEKQMDDYELRPASGNPDLVRRSPEIVKRQDGKPSIQAQLEQGAERASSPNHRGGEREDR